MGIAREANTSLTWWTEFKKGTFLINSDGTNPNAVERQSNDIAKKKELLNARKTGLVNRKINPKTYRKNRGKFNPGWYAPVNEKPKFSANEKNCSGEYCVAPGSE